MVASKSVSSRAVPELSRTVDKAEVTRSPPAVTLVPVIIAAAYVAAEIVLYTNHEAWLDEAQAWLVARNLSRAIDFLVIPSEGHPPVWYWMLRLVSYGLTFDQARPLMLGVAAVNAWLLVRLLGDRPALLAVLLVSLPILHSWGFHFRPYPLILTCVVSALLLDRAGRGAAATWLLALTCGFNFLGGWLLAFWLLVQTKRGISISRLWGPSLLGAAFGVSAILSSLGNSDTGVQEVPPLEAVFDPVALPFAIPYIPPVLIISAVIATIVFGLRRTPYVLVCVIGLLALLGVFGAFLYGLKEWHTAFGLMLLLMAFEITKASAWPLILLLLPQDFWGVRRATLDATLPESAAIIAYHAVQDDAGSQLDTERNLVAWPDHVLTPAAASYGFRFISANNGAVVDAIDWRRGVDGQISQGVLAKTPTPYWFVCFQCESPLAVVEAAGRRATQIMPATETMSWTLAAYRID